MTTETSQLLKKNLCTMGLFFAFFLVLAGIGYLTGRTYENGVKASAATVLEAWNAKAPEPGERVSSIRGGWSFSHVWTAMNGSRKTGLVFAVRVTGNSGPYTGIFLYTPENGAVFCGLAGMTDPARDPASCGITDRILSQWIRKINRLAAVSEKAE